MDINILLYVSFLVLCVTLTLTESKVEQSEDGTEGKISFSTPDLNDEEEHSPFMPTQLKCDACRVIVHKLYEKFTDVNKKRKSLKYKLPESEVLDATEAICGDKDTFDGYGIKEVKKVKRLSGPGLETAEVPGVMQGGGKWPSRLMDQCEMYMGEIGEMEVYEAYKRNPEDKQTLENFLCKGSGVRGLCSSKNNKKEEL